MTAQQQMLFTCNRCKASHVVPLQNVPGGAVMAPPEDWKAMRIGDTLTHFCTNCAREFTVFMTKVVG